MDSCTVKIVYFLLTCALAECSVIKIIPYANILCQQLIEASASHKDISISDSYIFFILRIALFLHLKRMVR